MNQINAGDLIRFSTALLNEIHNAPDHLTQIVKVAEVRTEADGSKTLYLERTNLQPCECGCGKLVEGGMMEVAHLEDYRGERG